MTTATQETTESRTDYVDAWLETRGWYLPVIVNNTLEWLDSDRVNAALYDEFVSETQELELAA